MKTGNTPTTRETASGTPSPQWSPVMKTGNTFKRLKHFFGDRAPQWSPVMKTGNTGGSSGLPIEKGGLNGARS